MKLWGILCALALIFLITASLSCREVDQEAISRILFAVDDWKGLALLLDLASSRIETECAQESSGARHECYRRSLIRRYCDKCPSGSPEEVAEQIAQVLEEKMGHKRQAQQLRELRFSTSEKAGSSLGDRSQSVDGSYCRAGDLDDCHSDASSSLSHRTLSHQHITETPAPPLSLFRFADYVKAIYRNLPLAERKKLPYSPGKVFIKLALIKKEPVTREEADHFTRLTLQGHVDQILLVKKPIEMEDIFNDSTTRLVVVEGAPGIGKSTFAWELCRQWSTGRLLQQFSLVVLLRLREEGVQTAVTISDLLYHHNTELRNYVGNKVEENEGEGVLFIFDGFDEFPAELLRKSLVIQVIGGSYLPKAAVLVTSRPSATADLLSICQTAVEKHIEIVGFSEDEIQEYAKSIFAKRPELLLSFKEYLFANPVVRGMMYNPLNCGIVVDVYLENFQSHRPIPHTQTQLYTELSLNLLLQHIQNISYEELPSDLESFQQSNIYLYEQLMELGKIALQGVETKTVIFKSKQVPENCKNLGLLNSCSELFRHGKAITYNFFHLTLQEYLGAFYISQLPAKEQRKLFVKHRQLRHLDVVWQFVAGLTKLQAIGWEEFAGREQGFGLKDVGWGVVKVWPFVLRCLYEAQNAESCRRFSEQSKVMYDGYHCTTPFDAYAVGYCISLCGSTWDLNLASNGLGPEVVRLLGLGLRSLGNGDGSVGELDLSYNHINAEGIEHLSKFPREILCKIRSLDVANCDLGKVGFNLLADTLPYLSRLESLDLSYNQGGDGSLVRVLRALGKHSTIQKLTLKHTDFSRDDVMALSEVVNPSESLKDLWVDIGDVPLDCVSQFVKTVFSTSSLTELHMNVPPTVSPLNHIEFLSENLTKLYLWSFKAYYPPKETKEIRVGILDNLIGIGKQLFQAKGGINFSNILRENRTLKMLDMLIPLEESEVRAIVDALKINPIIVCLGLSKEYHLQYFSELDRLSLDERIEWKV